MIGSTLAGYTIAEKIGQGGMSTVYRAQQTHMGRDVALKVIIPELAGFPGFVARFMREATILAGLQHPHILPIYDAGIADNTVCDNPTATGCAYMVMAYMAGGSLHELITHYPTGMPLPAVVRLVEQIASGIDALHERTITHSDIKPANILLDADHNAYIADFGIARIPGDTGGDAPGTYAYAPPEVSAGQPRGQLGDIYSLGVVTFQMLAGEPPYVIPDKAAMERVHSSKRVPDLSGWRPDLPPGVAVVVRQAMHHQATSRPRTATAFAQALKKAAGRTRPTPLKPRSTPRRRQPGLLPLPQEANDATTRRHMPTAGADLTTQPHAAPLPATVPTPRPVFGQTALTLMFIVGVALLLLATLISLQGNPPAFFAPPPPAM